MKNTIACGKCRFYHQQYSYKAGRRTKTWYGYCARQSTYPVVDADPESPPPIEVTRVEPEGRVHLKVVGTAAVYPACHFAEVAG